MQHAFNVAFAFLLWLNLIAFIAWNIALGQAIKKTEYFIFNSQMANNYYERYQMIHEISDSTSVFHFSVLAYASRVFWDFFP